MTKQELLDRKIVLEQEKAEIEAGGKFSSLLRSKENALSEYQDQINALDQKIKDAEREENQQAIKARAAAEADEKKRALLRVIIAQLPAEWKAEVGEDKYDGPFIKTGEGVGVSLNLKSVYSRTWSNNVSGTKLVVSTCFESRGFPRKKDGTFSIDKAVAFVKEQQEIQAAKQAKQTSEAQKLEQFRNLVKPFTQYGVYGTEQTFDVHNGFSLKVKRAYGEEERYIVWRTTNETVTAEQLTQILTNEVGFVDKNAGHATLSQK